MSRLETDFLPATELVRRFAAGALSPRLLVEQHFGRLDRFGPALNAFQCLDRDRALEAADASAGRWKSGAPLGPLDGIPMTVKDNLDLAGLPTRHGSLTTPETPAAADSPAVARLREAGVVLLGKTTLPEFGWKALTDSPLAGVTRNPWDLAHTPGGSSGGGAAAVAAGIGTMALGNDGGGSTRGPASYCGLVGFKPNFGRVPHLRDGLFATVVSDGPLALSVRDAINATAVMAGPEPRDWHSLPPAADWPGEGIPALSGLRLAYSPELGGAEPDAEVAGLVADALATLREEGATINAVGPVVEPLETRFAALWFGGFARRLRTLTPEQRDRLDPQLRKLCEEGMAVGTDDILQAEIDRAELWRRFEALHRRHDLLVTPTMPRTAPPVTTIYHTPGFDRWRDGVPYTLPFNLTGQPALTLPCGVTRGGLPVGLQIVGPRHADRAVLAAGLAIERALAFPQPHPRLEAKLAMMA